MSPREPEPDGKDSPGRPWSPLGTLTKLALIAAAVALAAGTYASLNTEVQQVFVAAFCGLGLISTVVMLVVLIRQSDGRR
jgi:hypothetical protein